MTPPKNHASRHPEYPDVGDAECPRCHEDRYLGRWKVCWPCSEELSGANALRRERRQRVDVKPEAAFPEGVRYDGTRLLETDLMKTMVAP